MPQFGDTQQNRSPQNNIRRSGCHTQVWSSVSPRAWCSSKRTPPTSRSSVVAVGLVGVAVLERPLEVGQLELPTVDHLVVPGGGDVAVEAGGHTLVRDDPDTRRAGVARRGLVTLDAEDVVDVAVRVDDRVSGARIPACSDSCACAVPAGLLVSTTTMPSSVAMALTFENAATCTVSGSGAAISPKCANQWCAYASLLTGPDLLGELEQVRRHVSVLM